MSTNLDVHVVVVGLDVSPHMHTTCLQVSDMQSCNTVITA